MASEEAGSGGGPAGGGSPAAGTRAGAGAGGGAGAGAAAVDPRLAQARLERTDSVGSSGSGGDPRVVWQSHGKHFFVLTESGRPIFSRYGNEFQQSAMMGLLQAIVSKSLTGGGNGALRTMRVGDMRIVFVLKGPVYLVAVSKTGEPERHLRQQLEHLHGCIVFVLTQKIFARLRKNPSYDMRNLLVGTRGSMLGIIHRANRSLSILFDAMPVLPLAKHARQGFIHTMLSAKTGSLAFAILVAEHQLVAYVQLKKKAYQLQPFDFIQITNFIQSSPSLKRADCWTPICLPKMNASGFLHAYVVFLTKHACLLLVSSSTSQENFMALSKDKAMIVEELRKGPGLRTVAKSLLAEGGNTGVAMLPGLLHFVYMWDVRKQFTQCQFPARFTEHGERKRLLRAYQHLFVRLRSPHPVIKQIAETTDIGTFVGVNTTDGCLLACFDRLFTPPEAYAASDKLIKAIKRRQDYLTVAPAVWPR